MDPAGQRTRRSFWVLLLLLVGAALQQTHAPAQESPNLEVQVLLDAGEVQKALKVLDRALKKSPKDAALLLQRSTAHFMEGDLDAGRRDLERSLALDPEQRQAWLNRAALDLSDQYYDRALEAFLKAESIDPRAEDNSLNIGAALLFKGNTAEAAERFRRYLEANAKSARAHYLVSANYAIAGRKELSMALLKKAIHLDEKIRLEVRTDPTFASLAATPEFTELLETDTYQSSVGELTASRHYDLPYTGRDSRVLKAVLSALQLAQIPFDPRVEVASRWALVWSDVRIKVSALGDTATQVEITSPPDRFSPQEWSSRTEDLFRRIDIQIHSRLPR